MKILLLFILLLALVSCGQESVIPVETKVTTEASSITIATEAVVPPPEMSPLAKADYLEPLDNFSWEREFAPEYVMLHFTSAVLVSKDEPYDISAVRKIFEDSGVSIHYIIDRDGGIYCYIPETRAAWHAGKGSFADDERLTNAMNKYSIGIELLAIGSKKDMWQYLSSAEYDALDTSLIGFTEEQYLSLEGLLSDICERNGIPLDSGHIIGHETYNPLKSDPGELFDWDRVLNKDN